METASDLLDASSMAHGKSLFRTVIASSPVLLLPRELMTVTSTLVLHTLHAGKDRQLDHRNIRLLPK